MERAGEGGSKGTREERTKGGHLTRTVYSIHSHKPAGKL